MWLLEGSKLYFATRANARRKAQQGVNRRRVHEQRLHRQKSTAGEPATACGVRMIAKGTEQEV